MKTGRLIITLYYKVLFMAHQNPSETLRDISDIKRIMERSSRFISLSGLSGIAAGLCGLGGAYVADRAIREVYDPSTGAGHSASAADLKMKLFLIAVGTLAAALVLAFLFTWRRAKRNHLPVWDLTARKLVWNFSIPIVAGGLFILALAQRNEWQFLAPACLVFYGLALVHSSKYTLTDIRYLGYLEIILGLFATQYPSYGLYFWAAGFGVLHIVYGAIMWWKYEKSAVAGHPAGRAS